MVVYIASTVALTFALMMNNCLLFKQVVLFTHPDWKIQVAVHTFILARVSSYMSVNWSSERDATTLNKI